MVGFKTYHIRFLLFLYNGLTSIVTLQTEKVQAQVKMRKTEVSKQHNFSFVLCRSFRSQLHYGKLFGHHRLTPRLQLIFQTFQGLGLQGLPLIEESFQVQ